MEPHVIRNWLLKLRILTFIPIRKLIKFFGFKVAFTIVNFQLSSLEYFTIWAD